MANKDKKTHAEKAAMSKNKKKSPGKKTTGKKTAPAPQPEKNPLPARLIAGLVFLGLFVLFLVIFLKPEGAVITLIQTIVLGLIGRIGFYVAIPSLLYLVSIQAFSGKRPVKLRSWCMVIFVLLSGCIFQLTLLDISRPTGFSLLKFLYDGGSVGTTAGLVCGGISLLLYWLFGKAMTYIILIVAAALTLMASFQITVPSIVRAIQNRPRPDWEEEPEELQEPAAVVVNHLANKHIEHVEQKRKRQAERAQIDIPVDDEPVRPTGKKPKLSPKAAEFMRDVDADLDEPVAAAESPVNEDAEIDLILDNLEKGHKDTPNISPMAPVPAEMPEFEKEPVSVEPVKEFAPEPAAPKPAKKEKDKVTAKDTEESAAQVAAEIEQAQTAPKLDYAYPPIDLLKLPSRSNTDGTMEMRENSRRLNETLASFRIEAHIINVTRGPSVTRYEVELDKGVRLNKLTTCADDIALSLGATAVRIAAVPGKISVVGIEVPNRSVSTVSLREVIDSGEFSSAKSKSSFAVGKDIGGSCIVGNIAKLPHMLIAGTTGSGKSVCMNSIIISLLYKASPEDVKFIMVDPKMVELGIYNGIPHLLIPVVTDPKKASGSLQWAVTEMLRRYRIMSDAGVRDLESYNSIAEADGGQKLPQVVVIIDELADLMMVAAKEVESSICRIAQMGRAAGIHLIIATQRPSADVITGLMKANIPSRIAFAVSSAMESRIILDTQGAEKLVGRGDMLFAPIGTGKPMRVQGCFVSDGEVEAVANYLKEKYITDYDQDVMDEIERTAAQTGHGKEAPQTEPVPTSEESEEDEMLPKAVDVILETGQASVSMLQRRLKLGYARAARIVDEMENKGIVGPFQGSKPRSILITKEQWEVQKNGLNANAQMNFDDLDDEDGGVPEELD